MDVITFGETMVVLTPQTFGYMRYASGFSVNIGGSESNVAIGLARLGHQSGWISRLGDDEFGKRIQSFIRGAGVDVSEVRIDPLAPTGLYFKETVTDQETRVHYYRKNSAASRMTPADINEQYLTEAKYLLVTGITPALSENCRETVMEAIKMAKKHQVTVVFDPNLRRKLWPDDVARKVLLEIASEADIILPGIDEGTFLFGESRPEEMAREFYDRGASCVVLKLGAKGAYYLSSEESGYVQGFPVAHVVDPVGAGDGFTAGFLSGLLDHLSVEKAVERGAAVGAMVTKIKGDFEGLPDRKELEAFIKGVGNADVIR